MPKPAWTDEQKLPSFPSMKRNLEVDVAVVGGGITGLTAAYLLKQSGLKVVVLEKGSLGQGEISHTTAHLTYVTDHRLNDLVDDVGREDAKATWEAGRAAIDQIEQIVRELNIDCEFERVPGYLHAPWTSNDVDLASLERDARYARDLGFAAQLVDNAPFVNAPAVRFDNQAKFHPYKYLDGLAKAIAGDGSFIFEDTEVEEITDDLICRVRKYRVQSKLVVVATHVPLMGKTNMLKAAMFQTKLSPYSTYALGARVPKGTIPNALFWDTSDPYYYLRVDEHDEDDFIVFGGCDHKTGQAADTNVVYKKLEGLLTMIVPRVRVTHRWSGQVIETLDGLPYIGETSKGQFVATGFCGNGITLGTAAGLMAVDLAHGRKNPWADLFSPRRKALQHPLEYMRENKDYPYYMVKDWLNKAEDLTPEEIPPGEGHILSVDGHTTAVSRDDDGRLSSCSAVCTHMGCVVHWNQAEQTWDCPCHGSRFTPSGEVIAGPAETPLEKQKLPETARHE